MLLEAAFAQVLLPPAPGPAWGWPVARPVVVRGFAAPAVRYAAGHRGVDLAASVGDPVRSAGAGRVTYAGILAGRGVAVVSHGALRTTYEPVLSSVAVGALVSRGQILGTVSTGHGSCPRGPCLHWGLRRGETYLNPLLLVRAGPSRLLPLGAPQGAPNPAAPRNRQVQGVPPAQQRRAAPTAPDDPAISLVSREVSLAGGSVLLLLLAYGLAVRRGHRPGPQPTAPAGRVVDLARERAERRVSPDRRACRAAAGQPWCASDRCGSP